MKTMCLQEDQQALAKDRPKVATYLWRRCHFFVPLEEVIQHPRHLIFAQTWTPAVLQVDLKHLKAQTLYADNEGHPELMS